MFLLLFSLVLVLILCLLNFGDKLSVFLITWVNLGNPSIVYRIDWFCLGVSCSSIIVFKIIA